MTAIDQVHAVAPRTLLASGRQRTIVPARHADVSSLGKCAEKIRGHSGFLHM